MINYSVNQNLSWRKLGDHTIILDTTTNKQVHHLNETASIIWQGLIDKCSFDEITHSLSNEFELAKHEIKSDIEELIAELQLKQLILPS